jgi:hypothetical protein
MKESVDEIIKRISIEEGVTWIEAKTMLHKYVCGGKCSWYKKSSQKANFNRHDISDKQRKMIEVTVKNILKNLTIEKAKWKIHEILCPGHPRPRPKQATS